MFAIIFAFVCAVPYVIEYKELRQIIQKKKQLVIIGISGSRSGGITDRSSRPDKQNRFLAPPRSPTTAVTFLSHSSSRLCPSGPQQQPL